MTVRFDNTGIENPSLEFDRGVAAIDVFTLNKAGLRVDELGFDIQLPEPADVVVPHIFDELCVVEVDPGPTVTVTIDTQKMRWAVDGDDVDRSCFSDYTNTVRYAVRFDDQNVFLIDGLGVTAIPTKLPDGRGLSMWFAEVPLDQLRALGFYDLHAMAGDLTTRITRREYDQLLPVDWLTVPAQQIRWQRQMTEILSVNQPQIEDICQRAFMALDETGVRVKAETEMRCGGIPPDWQPPTFYEFGAKHPVIMWLTEPGSVLPFAVIATTAEAWLDLDARVSFADSEFTK